MSYCMWQNTLLALRQCSSDFEERACAAFEGSQSDLEQLSREELAAMQQCFELMAELLQAANVDEDCNDPGAAAAAAINQPAQG
jgi:hypothetical protein